MIASSGVSEFFLGIILVPIIGNVAEHLVSVQLALKNKMELSVEVATSSSLQIALFVAPLLVFISLLLGHPLQLIFNRFELLAVLTAVVVSALATLESTEREYIVKVVRECHGRIGGANGAAARLGLKRTTLNSRMKKLRILRGDWR